jgi:hypothetical protein
MNDLDKFFSENSIEELEKRYIKKTDEKNNELKKFYNLNVANLGTINGLICRSNFINKDSFTNNAFFSYRLRDRCTEEINKLILEEMPQSEDFQLSITYGSSLISNLLALNFHIFFKKKPLILTSNTEHIGGIGPFTDHAVIRRVALKQESILSNIIEHKPDIVFLSHFSYDLGLSIDFKFMYDEVSKLKNKPIIIIDCAQSLGCIELPFNAADIIFGSCHKWLCGPKGLGLVWIKNKHVDKISSLGGDKGDNASSFSITGGADFLSFYELLCSLISFFQSERNLKKQISTELKNELASIFQIIPSDHKSMVIVTSIKDLLPYYLKLLDNGIAVKYFQKGNYFRLSMPYYYRSEDICDVVRRVKTIMRAEYV